MAHNSQVGGNDASVQPNACGTPARARRAPALWPFGRALVLAAVLSSVTAALAGPAWVMVPGAGVGRVTLGMKGAELFDILGTPTGYCVLSVSADEEEAVTVLYYPNRGIALTLSAWPYEAGEVARIHIVAGYLATLSDEAGTGANGRWSRKCLPHGTLRLDVFPGAYITSNGIRPGSSENDVVSKFGPPQAAYPAVTAARGHPVSEAEVETLLLHRLFLLPDRAQILAYDGIIFGIYHASVVAVTIDSTGHRPRRYSASRFSPRIGDPKDLSHTGTMTVMAGPHEAEHP